MGCLNRRVRGGQAPHPGLRRATEMALDCARGMQYLHARKCAPDLLLLLLKDEFPLYRQV